MHPNQVNEITVSYTTEDGQYESFDYDCNDEEEGSEIPYTSCGGWLCNSANEFVQCYWVANNPQDHRR